MNKRCHSSAKGMTLLELAVVITIIALVLAIVPMKSIENVRKQEILRDVRQFSDVMRSVAEYAVLAGKTYEIELDIIDCVYYVYEAGPLEEQQQENKTESDQDTQDDVHEEERDSVFEELTMQISFIEEIRFANGSRQYSGLLVMRATPLGWDKSVLFKTLDDNNEYYNYIRLDQGTTRVLVSEFPLEILPAKKDVRL